MEKDQIGIRLEVRCRNETVSQLMGVQDNEDVNIVQVKK